MYCLIFILIKFFNVIIKKGTYFDFENSLRKLFLIPITLLDKIRSKEEVERRKRKKIRKGSNIQSMIYFPII